MARRLAGGSAGKKQWGRRDFPNSTLPPVLAASIARVLAMQVEAVAAVA